MDLTSFYILIGSRGIIANVLKELRFTFDRCLPLTVDIYIIMLLL